MYVFTFYFLVWRCMRQPYGIVPVRYGARCARVPIGLAAALERDLYNLNESMLRGNVLSSCRSLLSQNSGLVRLDRDGQERLIDIVRSAGRDMSKAMEARRYPLRFEDVSHEISFLTLMHLLQFGSSYSAELQRLTGSSASDAVQRGLVGLFLSGPLSADRLNALSITEVETLFRIPLTRDERMGDATPMYISKPTSVRPLADSILAVLHECGRILRARQSYDFIHLYFNLFHLHLKSLGFTVSTSGRLSPI